VREELSLDGNLNSFVILLHIFSGLSFPFFGWRREMSRGVRCIIASARSLDVMRSQN
jgi:hypothetical protein